jgi:translocation and assembly module TamA
MTKRRAFAGILSGLALLGGVALFLAPSPASAFDPFSFFTAGKKSAPAPAPAILPYRLDVAGIPDSDLRASLDETSILRRLETEPPVNGEELVRRVETDLPRLIDLMWGSGYYAARVRIEVAGEVIGLQTGDRTRAAALAERDRAQRQVPVRIVVEPGALYRFGEIRLRDPAGASVPEDRVPPRLYRELPGQPARTETLATTASAITTHIRELGHPFARIADPEPVIDHRTHVVALDLVLSEGPQARIGAASISKTDGIDPRVIRSHLYLDDPTLYSPRRIAEIRRSIGRIEAVGSVRVREGETLAPDGTLPVDIEVTQRPKNVLGGSLGYSTIDGPALKTYWAHRNLFGGAERLRLEADLFYLANSQQWLGTKGNRLQSRNLGGRFGVGFIKPAIAGSRFDFLFDAYITRNATQSYTTRLANAVAAFRYRFADKAWVQAELEGEFGQTTDVLGRMTYRLVGLPVSGSWDTTDNELDPRRGFRVSGSVTPYLGFGEVARTLVVGKFQVSAYRALDEAERFVLAGKVGLGSIMGGSVAEIPANRRFFAGGGGSVRGFEYRSLGPRNAANQLIGGRSMFEASLELRVRVTETIGIVPFFDVGTAFDSSLPNFDNRLRMGAGLGLRYHTPIGPIRLDVATPLDRRKGEKPVALYISLGQAF